jgi:hypothetical protein
MTAAFLPIRIAEWKQIRSITITPDSSAIYVPGFNEKQSITERPMFT